jgi:hypothetical protein
MSIIHKFPSLYSTPHVESTWLRIYFLNLKYNTGVLLTTVTTLKQDENKTEVNIKLDTKPDTIPKAIDWSTLTGLPVSVTVSALKSVKRLQAYYTSSTTTMVV